MSSAFSPPDGLTFHPEVDEALHHSPHALAIVPHPDDESWAMGGLLSRMAQRGVRVHLATITDGSDVRRRELRRACRILQLIPPDSPAPCRDGHVTEADAHAFICERLETIQPALVFGLGADGGYAHIDHTTTARALFSACSATRTRPPLLLTAESPRHHFAPVRRTLRRRTPALIDPRLRGRALGIARVDADLIIHLSRQEADTKRRALRAHVSQFPPQRSVADFVQPGSLTPFFEQEWYRIHSSDSAAHQCHWTHAGTP